MRQARSLTGNSSVELGAALLQLVEHQVGGHHLAHRCRRDALVGALVEQHRAGLDLDRQRRAWPGCRSARRSASPARAAPCRALPGPPLGLWRGRERDIVGTAWKDIASAAAPASRLKQRNRITVTPPAGLPCPAPLLVDHARFRDSRDRRPCSTAAAPRPRSPPARVRTRYKAEPWLVPGTISAWPREAIRARTRCAFSGTANAPACTKIRPALRFADAGFAASAGGSVSACADEISDGIGRRCGAATTVGAGAGVRVAALQSATGGGAAAAGGGDGVGAGSGAAMTSVALSDGPASRRPSEPAVPGRRRRRRRRGCHRGAGQPGRSEFAAHRRLGDLDALLLHDPDAYRRHAGIDETEQLRRAARHVDQAVLDKRAAIVDAQPQRAAVLQIADLDDARQRQCLVCRRHLVHVVDLAVRRRLAVEARAVPRGGAGLVVIVVTFG